MGARESWNQTCNNGWRRAARTGSGLPGLVEGLCRSFEVSGDAEFRSPEQEVLKLLDECAELRRTLKSISSQVGRMEIRLKRAFPVAAELVRDRAAKGAQ